MKKEIIEVTHEFYEDCESDIVKEVVLEWVKDGFNYEASGYKGFKDESHWSADKTPQIEVRVSIEGVTPEEVENMVWWFQNEDHEVTAEHVTEDSYDEVLMEIKFDEPYYDGDLQKMVIPVDEIDIL